MPISPRNTQPLHTGSPRHALLPEPNLQSHLRTVILTVITCCSWCMTSFNWNIILLAGVIARFKLSRIKTVRVVPDSTMWNPRFCLSINQPISTCHWVMYPNVLVIPVHYGKCPGLSLILSFDGFFILSFSGSIRFWLLKFCCLFITLQNTVGNHPSTHVSTLPGLKTTRTPGTSTRDCPVSYVVL